MSTSVVQIWSGVGIGGKNGAPQLLQVCGGAGSGVTGAGGAGVGGAGVVGTAVTEFAVSICARIRASSAAHSRRRGPGGM